MKYLPYHYRTKGFDHIQIKRYRDIYIYEKYSTDTGHLVCDEIFKARIRPATKEGLVPNPVPSHRFPSNEDFGKTATQTSNREKTVQKFKEFR